MMSKNIIVLCASPVKGGNSDTLANVFIEGAREAGHTAELIKLVQLDIRPCLGCDYCRSNNFECTQKDDMQPLYNLLERSDVIVFSTPLYFMTFPAQLKTVIDRLYCKHHGRKLIGKESVLLVSSGSPNPAGCDNLISTYQLICTLLGWNVVGHVTVGGYPHDGSINSSLKLQDARALGRNLCKE